MWSWVINKPAPIDERVGVFLGIAARLHLEHENVWMTADGRSAAIWAPPKLWRIAPRRIVRHMPRSLWAGGLRSLSAFAALGETERRHPTDAHWYLAALGTDPEARGRGLASAVMGPVLDRCDAEDLGAYLESSKEQNIPFYERHGFDVIDTIDLDHGGPRLWTMWRNPKLGRSENGAHDPR